MDDVVCHDCDGPCEQVTEEGQTFMRCVRCGAQFYLPGQMNKLSPYQVRFDDGGFQEFNSFQEIVNANLNYWTVEKISFNGPDGTRIRLVFNNDGAFDVTGFIDTLGNEPVNNYVNVFTRRVE